MSTAIQNEIDRVRAANEELSDWLEDARCAATSYKIERDAALEREAALGAALREAQCITANWYDNEENIGECLNKMDHWAIKTMHPDRFRDCLTNRDLIKQAEALEEFADNANPNCEAQDAIVRRAERDAEELRQRAQALD